MKRSRMDATREDTRGRKACRSICQVAFAPGETSLGRAAAASGMRAYTRKDPSQRPRSPQGSRSVRRRRRGASASTSQQNQPPSAGSRQHLSDFFSSGWKSFSRNTRARPDGGVPRDVPPLAAHFPRRGLSLKMRRPRPDKTARGPPALTPSVRVINDAEARNGWLLFSVRTLRGLYSISLSYFD